MPLHFAYDDGLPYEIRHAAMAFDYTWLHCCRHATIYYAAIAVIDDAEYFMASPAMMLIRYAADAAMAAFSHYALRCRERH